MIDNDNLFTFSQEEVWEIEREHIAREAWQEGYREGFLEGLQERIGFAVDKAKLTALLQEFGLESWQ